MVVQMNKIQNNEIPIKKQINKMKKTSLRSKKIMIKKSNNFRNINQVSMNTLYLSDLKTTLNPEQMLNIIFDASNNFSIAQVSKYIYNAVKIVDQVDFVFDEETFDVVQVNNQLAIEFSFEIKQIQEIPNYFTIAFMNHSQNKDLEFTQMQQELIQKIATH